MVMVSPQRCEGPPVTHSEETSLMGFRGLSVSLNESRWGTSTLAFVRLRAFATRFCTKASNRLSVWIRAACRRFCAGEMH